MRSFPRFFPLWLACICGGTSGFVTTTVKSVATSRPCPPSAITTRVPPLIQAASVSVEPNNKSLIKTAFKSTVHKYVVLSEERPLVTNGVSAAVVGAIGDVFSQTLFAYATGTAFRWDTIRTLTFMMMGLCFKGPALHAWYNFLGRIAHWTKVRKGFSETKQSLTALTVDQTLGVAIFYPMYFIVFEVFSAILTKRFPNLLALQTKMAATMIPVILTQYYVWPLANFLSFKYCPPSLRVLYSDGISIFWNCFLCARLAA